MANDIKSILIILLAASLKCAEDRLEFLERIKYPQYNMMTLGNDGMTVESFFRHFIPRLSNSVEPHQLDKVKSELFSSSPIELGTLFAALMNDKEIISDFLVKHAIKKRTYPSPFVDGNCIHACPMLLLNLSMYESSMIRNTDVLQLLDSSPTVQGYTSFNSASSIIEFLIDWMFGRKRPEFSKDFYGFTPTRKAPIMNTVGILTLRRIMSELTPELRTRYAGKRFIAFGDIISTLENSGISDQTYVFALDISPDGKTSVINQIRINAWLEPSHVILFWPKHKNQMEEEHIE